MSKLNFNEVIDQICAQDNRYEAEAYTFVREGLDHTLKSLKRSANSTHRHVSGQELLNGLRDHALKEYGPMSKAVLNEWGISTCEDFGNIVFNLVNSSILGKTDADSPSDFKNGFNFDEAFVKPFEPRRDHVSGRKAAPHARSTKRSSKKSSAGSL